jgi:NarL family two-component system sensor histidine kinase YdfH
LADARRAIKDLRDVPESVGDLDENLRREVERFSAATGIPCDLSMELPGPIPESISLHVQRIAAEGLSNVAQHAQANQVWLSARSDQDRLDLQIRDDGMGFDPSELGSGDHYGLVGMRERVRLAGGSMEISTGAGQGTRLNFTFPLGAEARSDIKTPPHLGGASDG